MHTTILALGLLLMLVLFTFEVIGLYRKRRATLKYSELSRVLCLFVELSTIIYLVWSIYIAHVTGEF